MYMIEQRQTEWIVEKEVEMNVEKEMNAECIQIEVWNRAQ